MTSSGAVPRGKQVKCKVLLLDDTMPTFQVSYKAHGCDLFDAVVKHLRLLESDYFGLEYKDATGVLRWLDNEKYIVKQTGSQHDMSFRFSVKFYTPDPGLLEEEFTRYLFALQVKRDLASGSMPCNMNTAALLSAYIAQAEIGDYNYEEFTDYTYLSSIRFVPNQSNEMEEKIAEHHKNLIGHTPADADYLLLDTARKVETYGVVLHPARDHEGVPLYLSVAHMGVLVFQNNTKINTFSWAKIRKLSFKRKRFLIKLHPEGYDYYKDTVDFFFDTRDDCKAFWKKCIEHHAFFRCASIKRAPRNKTRVISRGSSFRYSGRTQKQLTDHVRENFVRRPGFERTTSVRVSSRSIGAKSNRSATLNSANASQRSLSSGSHILDDRPHDDGAAQQPSSRIETVEVHSDSSHSGALAEPGYASINYDRAAEGTPPPLYEEARPLEMNGHDLHLYETEPEPQPRVVDHEDAEDVKQNIEDLYSQVMKPHSRKLSAPDMSHLDHKEEERVVEEEHRLSRSYEVENIPVRVEEPEDHLRRTEELENIPDELGPQHGNETREEVENNKNLPRCKSESAAESMQVRMYSRPTSLSPHKEAKEESVFETQHHFNNTYGEVDYTVQTTAVTMTTSRSSEADDDRPPTPPPPLLDYQYENHVRERSEENNRVIVTSTSSSEQMMTSLTDQLQMTSMTTSPTEETPIKIQFSLGSAGSLPSREGDSTEEESRRKRYPADKAYYVAKELLMTERTYKKDLEVVTVWFQNAMSKDNVMPQYLSSMLFTQLQPIYEFHCSFLREIEQRLAMWEGKSNAHLNGNHQKIGDVVLSNLRGVLHLYQAYISQHGEILTELEQAVKEDRLFEQTYKDFESQKVCYLPLVTFLLKPAQRLLHYEIILQRLVNHYTTEHQDYHDCKASLQKIQELTNTFQDKMDELENLHKLIELERDLIGVDGLVQPSRKFLREGCLQKLSRKGYQQRMFFLFSDTLIYTSRTSTPALQFKVHGQLPLRGMIVEETDPKMAVANSFTIYGGNRCLLVAASSQEEKDKWMEDLNDASRAARTQRIEAGIKFQSLRGSTKRGAKNARGSTENIDGEEMAPPVEKQIQHRANTTMHVCWHRNTSVSYRDHRKAIKNQLSGYLLRKFKNSSGWQKLWVVFTNFCLFFYKTFQDDFPLASLPLLGYAVSTPGDEDGIHKDYVFKLQFKNHVYFFRAESQYTFERWMEVINSATHNARRMRVFSRMESDTPDRA